MVAPKPSTMYIVHYTHSSTKNGKSEHIDLESHIKVKENTHSLFIAADRRHRVKNKHRKAGEKHNTNNTNWEIEEIERKKKQMPSVELET